MPCSPSMFGRSAAGKNRIAKLLVDARGTAQALECKFFERHAGSKHLGEANRRVPPVGTAGRPNLFKIYVD
jgi:hypothetical protein